MLLQQRGRSTAAELADELQVSERTVLRDIEVLSGSGVPVYATRGRHGGFQLLDTDERPAPPMPAGLAPSQGRLRRVRVRLAPHALQMALLLGKPEAWRPRPHAEPGVDRPDWLEGSFRFDSDAAAIAELLALGPDVEVLLPLELRASMAEIGRRIATLHSEG